MRHFIFPSQDASIYQNKTGFNSGLDEILEVGKAYPSTGSIRSLIEFDITDISDGITNGTYPPTTKFDLTLYVANAKKLERNQSISAIPVSQSWTEGNGYAAQDMFQQDNGVTWLSRSTGSLWAVSGSSTIGTGVSASITPTVLDTSCKFNITDIVRQWVSGTIPNNGLVLKFPTSDELLGTNKGWISFFSRNTHTIYIPSLEIKWDDQTYSTGSSLTLIPRNNSVVTLPNVKPIYHVGEVARVDVSCRPRYPAKTFDNRLTLWDNLYYLPSSSYYKIVDEQTNNDVIPFDEFSKISTDSSGSFFNFKVENMYPYRYYKIVIKVENNGSVDVFDTNTVFSVR